MVKVRFAPSPTGFLHIGNFRTALVNFLFARKEKGHFMLRIDDTDHERSSLEFEKAIIEDLSWMNFKWDSLEKQSTRLKRYDEALETLLDKKRAYACYETAEELSLKRKAQLSSGNPPVYDRSSLRLSDSDVADLKSKGKKPHYRFLLDHTEVIWNDLIKGGSKYHMSSLSDPVVLREDGRVIYTLASVVDDIDFDITHILRGEDHMTNSAAQIQLFEALGSAAPNLGHLSLLTDISGAGLSKRLGSLSLKDLRNEGIHPMAISSLLSKVAHKLLLTFERHAAKMLNMETKQAIVYVRASTNEAKQSNSHQMQLHSITEFAKSHDYQIVKVFTEYASGTLDERPVLAEVLAYAKEHDCYILAYRLDRVSRSLTIFNQLNPCLLYTSPSPRDRTRSRMPSSA